MTSKRKKLISYGFVEVGKWELDNGVKSGITFKIDKSDFLNKRVVYAFVVCNEVKYIGVCDNKKTKLKGRMERYKYLSGAGTNARVVKEIKGCLNSKPVTKSVKIFALEPQVRKYEDLNVDLVKGLEYPLIERLKPDWNKQQK